MSSSRWLLLVAIWVGFLLTPSQDLWAIEPIEPEPLGSLREIRDAGLADGQSTRVDFEGVVTYQDPVWRFFFAQDPEHDVGVFVLGRASELRVGDCVRVKGELQAGLTNPIVIADKVWTLDTCQLPPPIAMKLTEDSVKQNDSLRVQIDCEVEQVIVHARHTLLMARADQKPLYISVAEWGFIEEAVDLLGKRIRCTGSLGVQVRERDEKAIAAKLFCPAAEDIQTLAGETIDIAVGEKEVLTVADTTSDGGRFLTHGQISYIDRQPHHETIVVTDNSGASSIAVSSSEGLFRGMIVRIAGTVDSEQDPPLRADYLRVLAHQEIEIPEAVTVSEAFPFVRPPQSIALIGTPSELIEDDEGRYFLVLRDDESEIDVWLRDEASLMLKALDPTIAKRVQVLGVVTPSTRQDSKSQYQLVVSAPGDIQLLEEYVFPLPFALASLTMVGIAAFSWIVTLRRQVAQQTQNAVSLTAQLRSSYDSIDDGILAVDNDDRILAINREFCRMLGQRLHVGESAAEVPALLSKQLQNREQFAQFVEDSKSLSEGDSIQIELDFAPPKNWNVSIASALILAGKQQQPIGRIWTLRDETDKRRLENELSRSSKLEAVGRLAGGVAHDFNNILTAIAANLSVARAAEKSQVHGVREELELAEHAAYKGADVVRRLLMFSKQFDPALEPQFIHSIITSLTKLLRHDFGETIHFELELCSENPVVLAESAALEQVLINLYVNARDAMPGGGKITTATRVFKSADQLYCRISIRDEGPGIPEEIREKVFEPFFTTKGPDEGTGLGLSTSFRVIEQHHGSLRLGECGVSGSEFQIDLPLSEEKPVEKPAPRESTGTASILVVDDEYAIRFATRHLLEGRGFAVVEAENGDRALQLLIEDQLEVDAVVLDLTMPGRTGSDVLTAIKSTFPEMPVLVCTGFLPQDFKETSEFAPDGILTKPYETNDLIDQLNAIIKPRRG